MSDDLVQIRRYPNRRLYDRSRQRYVTLPEIEELILAGRTVEIIDSRTGEDLTRSILTQILIERHPDKIALFPVGMLHSILRSNDAVADFWRWYLRESLGALERLQTTGLPFASPLGWMSALLPTSRGSGREHHPSGTETLEQRINELTRRLDRLESRGQPAPPSSVSPQGDAVERLEERVRDLEERREE